ncbi:hypothetical protein SHELI_v1c05380 [Spiroplasma helicoides]|uniref:Uncharacterized protein n=1 Tax=Spiroplasma helicoides TaxID=216938 RepID=A0A1B3SKM8_9MOLU|nr:hypothetical protein [Spiroplasma helicoides]AOG60489.1 hypothetical protein SHELI_v1c05380 [Spiroplasma helicoides]
MKPKLLKEQLKFVNKILVFNPFKFAYFCVDQVLLLLTIGVFIYGLIENKMNWLSYLTLGLTAYLLLKFVIVNWFKINIYYKYIKVYDFKLNVDKNKVKISRTTDHSPLWFLVWTVATTVITAIICQYEVQNLVETKNPLNATLSIVMNMLLIPSFINSFNAISANEQQVSANYIHLVKDQYYSNESLFENTEWGDKHLNLTCSNIGLTSKNGIFVLLNQDDLSTQESRDVNELNSKILETYKKIWSSYYDLLQNRMKEKYSKGVIRKFYWIERIYDTVFLDFFQI